MKKIICLVLALVLCTALAVPAMATQSFWGGNYDDITFYETVDIKGTVTVAGAKISLRPFGTITIKENGQLNGTICYCAAPKQEAKIILNDGGGINVSLSDNYSANNFAALLDAGNVNYSRVDNTFKAGNCNTTPPIAEGSSEMINFQLATNLTSENGNFELSADRVKPFDGGYWQVDGENSITIRAKNGYTITRIDAVIVYGGDSYGTVGVSGNAHKEQNGEVANGSTVSVTNINDSVFSFTGGSFGVGFKNIKVYYKDGSIASALSEGSIWIIIAVAVAAVGTVAALVIVKKRKKLSLAGGTENTVLSE